MKKLLFPIALLVVLFVLAWPMATPAHAATITSTAREVAVIP